jgi:homocysteine S-methyltransferase
MATRNYSAVVGGGRLALTDAAVGTRLRYGTPWSPDEHVRTASFATTPEQARAARALFVAYATVAREFGLPIVLYAPTSRATPDRSRAADLPVEGAGSLNERCVRLVQGARDQVAGVEAFVAGVVGPAHDAFDPASALADGAARAFHEPHVRLLDETGCDLLIAAPFPAVSEAMGVAKLFAETGREYLIALVLGGNGKLLDGTRLGDAIDQIDDAATPPPVHYLIQCVHPRRAGIALDQLAEEDHPAYERVLGVKANAADASARALDASTTVQADEPEPWAQQLYQLHERHGLTLLGGCCGTDERHLFSLALRMASDHRTANAHP